jgi:hypothetical protein
VDHHEHTDATNGRWLQVDPYDLVSAHLAQAGCGWSVGVWGAIGEFSFQTGEPGLAIDRAGLEVSTARGALRIRRDDAVRAFAVRVNGDEVVREIAICLPGERARRTARGCITELGPDRDAVKAADRDRLLFDLGIAAPHVDMSVRVDREAVDLLLALRGGRGRSFLADAAAAAAVLAHSPARIFDSALARLEVVAPIPPPGGRSPDGPHSHLLPSLLAQKRTRGPKTPLPVGWACCLSLYPGRA